MKRSLSVFLHNLPVACLCTPVFRRRAAGVLAALFILLGALICPGTAEARLQDSAPESILSDAGVGKDAGRLLTALTDRAVTLDSPILGASLVSMNAAAERKDAKPEGEGEKQETAPTTPSAPPAPAAAPTPAAQDFAEVDELDLFLFELSEVEHGTAPAREASRPNPDAAPVTAPENSLGGGGTSSSPSNTPQPASPTPAAEADSRVPSTKPASRSSEGKGVSGISLTELADAMPVAVVMPIEEKTYVWNKTDLSGGDLEWHSLTDWGGDSGYVQGSNVTLEGFGGNVYLCGFDNSSPKLEVKDLELKQALWTFRSVQAEQETDTEGGGIHVEVTKDVVDSTHSLEVTGKLTLGSESGLLLGEGTTIDVKGGLYATTEGENAALLSLGKGSSLIIDKIGDGTNTDTSKAHLSSLTFDRGSTLKLSNAGTLSMQSIVLNGNGTLEMDVSQMTDKDKRLMLDFLGKSTNFTESEGYLTIKLVGLTVENLKALKGQGGKLQDEAFYIFNEATKDQGDIFSVLKIETSQGLYSPFYAFLDPQTNLITIKVKDPNLYWTHKNNNHNWFVGNADTVQHWKEGDAATGTDKEFPSGGTPWHGDVFFNTLTGTDEAKDFESYTRDEGNGYGGKYSLYRVYFKGDPKTEAGQNEHVAVSVRGNMTVKEPHDGTYYWFKPSNDPPFKDEDGDGKGGTNSGAVDEQGNIHWEGDEHKQHQFQLRIGRADTGNFTEDKLILESTARFSGNVAFYANVMTHFDAIEDPYKIAEDTELIVGDGAAFYQALNRSERDEDGNIIQQGFDGTLTIWSQNAKIENEYGEFVYNSLKKGGDIIRLHMEKEVGARLLIGQDGNDETHDGTVTLTVEELTGGHSIDKEGDIFGDTLIFNDTGKWEDKGDLAKHRSIFEGVIASSLEYNRRVGEDYKGDPAHEFYLRNSFRGPRLTVVNGKMRVKALKPMYKGVYNWLKGKNDPAEEAYEYLETYDTDTRVVVEKGGELTVENIVSPNYHPDEPERDYEGAYPGDHAWLDVVVEGKGDAEEEGGGKLVFGLWSGGDDGSPVKSLRTGEGATVELLRPSSDLKALDLWLHYLGGEGGSIVGGEGEQEKTLTLKYDKPDPEAQKGYYDDYKKEFEGEYAEFSHYGGEIGVNFTYKGTADYAVDGNGRFTGGHLTMDGVDSTLTLTNPVGDTGEEGSGGDGEDFGDGEAGVGVHRPDVTVNQGTLVLKEESHIGDLSGKLSGEGSGGTVGSGRLVLEKGGSIQEMTGGKKEARLGSLEVADHLTLNTGDFYFGTLSTREASQPVSLYFKLSYDGSKVTEAKDAEGGLSGTKLHVDRYDGMGRNRLMIEADKDIVDALRTCLESQETGLGTHDGEVEWQLFEQKGFQDKWTEYSGFFLNYNEDDLMDDRRIFYLSSWGALVMEDLKADIHWLGTGEEDHDTWYADKNADKDWFLDGDATDYELDEKYTRKQTAFRGKVYGKDTNYDADNVFFDSRGRKHQNVKYSGAVQPGNMTVNENYTFTPEGKNDSIYVHGNLTVDDATATFSGGGNVTVGEEGTLKGASGTVDVQGGTFTVKSELEDNGADGFGGTLKVENDGTKVVLEQGGALYNLEMSDGTLRVGAEGVTDKNLTIEGLNGEGGTITGGTVRLTDPDGVFGGTVESTLTYAGTLYELYGKYKGNGLSVESGRLKITGANEEEAGKKLLELGERGKVEVNNGAALVLGGSRHDKEKDKEVTDVTVNGGLDLSGVKTTVSMEGSATNKVVGDVSLESGTTLSMFGSTGREITGQLTFSNGATLRWRGGNNTLVVGSLAGDGEVDNGGVLKVTNGGKDGTFKGYFANLTGLKLDAGNLTLTQKQEEGLGDVTVGGGATLTFAGGENTAASLTFAEKNGRVDLRGENDAKVKLTLSNLKGEKGSTIAGAEGSSLTLNYMERTSGSFAGDVAVNFEYNGHAAGGVVFTLSGNFTGASLEVQSGSLTLEQTLTVTTKEVALGNGSTLTLVGKENTAGTLDFAGTGGKVVLAAKDGATLTLSDLIGEEGNSIEGGKGKSVILNYSGENSGEFNGNVGVDFTYAGKEGGDPGYTLGGSFTGANLTVNSGDLTVKQKVTTGTAKVTLGENSNLTLAQGGTLQILEGGKGNLVLGGDTRIESMGSGLTSLHVQGVLSLPSAGKYTLGSVTLTGDTILDFDFTGAEEGTKVGLSVLNGIKDVDKVGEGHLFTLQFSVKAFGVLAQELDKDGKGKGYQLFEELGTNGNLWSARKGQNEHVKFRILDSNGTDVYGMVQAFGYVYLDESGYLHWMPNENAPEGPGDTPGGDTPNDPGDDDFGNEGGLTWRAEDGIWQEGSEVPDGADEKTDREARDWYIIEDLAILRENFENRDNVRFIDYAYDDRYENWTVQVTDGIEAGRMTVEGGDYTFRPEDGKEVKDGLTVKELHIFNGATAVFEVKTTVQPGEDGKGGGNLRNNGELTVKGTMGVQGTLVGKGDTTVTGGGSLTVGGAVDYTGALAVEGQGGVKLQDGGRLGNLRMSGGTLDFGGEGLTVAGLSGDGGKIAGTNLTLTAEGEFGGDIMSSALDYHSGGTFELYGEFNPRGKLTVKAGVLKLTGANDESGENYLTLQGGENMVVESGGHLVLGGERSFNADAKTPVANVTVNEGVTLVDGAALSIYGTASQKITGTLNIQDGADLNWQLTNPLVVGKLTGDGTLDNGGVLEVEQGTGNFAGLFENLTGLTLDAGAMTLTQGQSGLGAVTVKETPEGAEQPTTLTFVDKENTASSLEVGARSSVVLGTEKTESELNLGNLKGQGTIKDADANREKRSSVSLNYNEKESGHFDGSVGVDFKYASGNAAGDPGFVLNGDFSGKNLTVQSGRLTVDSAIKAGTTVTLGGASSILTLTNGGILSTLNGGNGNLLLRGNTTIEHMGGSALTSLHVQGVLTLPNNEMYTLGDVTLTGDTTLDFDFGGWNVGTKVTLRGLSGIGKRDGEYGFTLQFSETALDILKGLEEGYHLFFEDDGNCEWSSLVGFRIFRTLDDGTKEDIYKDDEYIQDNLYLDSAGILRWRTAGTGPNDPNNPGGDPNNPGGDGPGNGGNAGDALTWRAEDGVWQDGYDSAANDLDAMDWFAHGEDLPGNRDKFDNKDKDGNTDNVRFTEYYVNRDFWNVQVEGKIEAGRMSVTGGNYTFRAKNDAKGVAGSLTVAGLDVSAPATAEFYVGTTVTGNLRNEGELTVRGAMEVDGTMTGTGKATVEGEGAELKVDGETDYAGTLTLNGGLLEANGAVKDLHVGQGGGTVRQKGGSELAAELSSGLRAGKLTLAGVFELGGRTSGEVSLEGATTLTAYNLSVGGVSGGGDGTTLSGTLTVTGEKGEDGKVDQAKSYSYGGEIGDLDFTMMGGTQAFTRPGQTLKSTRVEGGKLELADRTTVTSARVEGGVLDLAGYTTVERALTVNGNGRVQGNGYLKAPSLQGTSGGALVRVGQLDLTGTAGEGSQYAGRVEAGNLAIQYGTHTLGSVAVRDLELNHGSHLHVGEEMELTGSLTLTLSDVYKDSPLMSAVGTQTFTRGKEVVGLNLHPVSTLEYGTYYLITEETGNLANDQGAEGKNLVKNQFTITDGGEKVLDAWAATMEAENARFNYGWQLHVIGHSLVLDLNRVFDESTLDNTTDLVWKGDGVSKGDGVTEEDVWADASDQNWHRKESPKDKNLYFLGYDEGSINDHRVTVHGTVQPKSVNAYSGEYTFDSDGTGEGIDLGDKVEEDGKGEFLVDGGRLHMQMKNKRIPRLDLKSGAFFIEHEAALPGNTQVRFGGGVLGFGEKRTVVRQGENENAGDGELFKNSEVWTNPGEVAQHLFLEENERLRIQAGKTYAEYMEYAEEHEQNVHSADYAYRSPAGEDKEDLDKDVVIGSEQVTPAGQQNVVPQALAQGVEKTGRFGMRLQWNIGQVAEVKGSVHVKEGRLTLQSYGEGKMTLKGDLTIAKGGTLHLWGKGQEVIAESNFKSTEPSTPRTEWLGEKFESRVVLGVEGDGTNYRVNGNNSEYDGTIVLRGDSGSDTAVFKDAKAAGHHEGGYPYPVTRLELHGRALTFDPSATQGGAIPEGVDAALWVNVERIEVADGTENLVGGYTQVDEGNPNARVALSGPLTGTGVLANAYSAGETAFQHTYTGALRGFGGTIVAGLLGTAPEEPEVAAADEAGKKSESIWTLNLTDATPEENTYEFRMAGTGEIKLNADVDITLTGGVGDLSGHLGNTVDLTNIGKKNITLAGASTTTGKLTTNKEGGNFILDGQGAAWAGTVLQGGGSFTLVEGELSHGADFVKPTDGSKLTVDAKGTVDVKGMDVERVGMGDITITGRSTVGEGEAQRERYGRLVGVNSDIDTANRRVTLVFDEYNFSSPDAMIEFTKGGGHSLKVTQNAEDKENPDKGLVLDFTTNALVGILREHNKQNGNVTDLRIAENGKLEIGDEFGETDDGGHLLRLLTGEEEDEITGRKNNVNGYGGLLYELGFTLNTWKAKDGILSLSGTSRDVYLILNDGEGGDYGSRPHDLYVGLYEGAAGGVLDGSKSVVVDQGEAFRVHFGRKAGKDGMPDEANGTVRESLTLRNLIGLEDSTLDVVDERSEEEKAQKHVTVNLVNETEEPKDDTAYGPDYGPVKDGEEHTVSGGTQKDGFNVRGQDTTFEGLIRGEETVDFVKQGAGQLTVGSEETRSGGLRLGGGLRLEDGGVTLQGDDSSALGLLTFGYTAKANRAGLTLRNGSNLTVHDIAEKSEGEKVGGDVVIGGGSVFTFDNSGRADGEAGRELADTHFRAAGEEDAGGFAVTGNGTDLTLNGVSTVEGVDVTVEAKEEEQATMTVQGDAKVETDGTLAVKGGGKVDLQQSAGNKVGSLIGDGTLSGEGGARLTVTGSDSNFTGTLTTSTAEQQRGSAVLAVATGAVLSMKDVKTDPAGAWNLDIVKGGRMELGKTEAKRDDKMMRFGDIGVQGGGNLTIKDKGKGYIAGDVQVDMSNGEKMEFTVELNGETGRVYLDLTFNEAGGNELNNPDLANAFSKNVEDFVDLGLTGLTAPHFEGVLRRDWDPDSKQKEWDGQWYIGLDKLTQNPYIHPGEPGDHKNVRAGAALTWDAQDPDSMAGKYLSSPQGSMGDLAMAVGAVQNATEQDRLLAALAGSSISTLTAAMLEDVKRQLESLRSRAAMLSCSEPKGNLEKDENKWQSWINGEMGRHDLDHESWGPGYRLVGWGGTVGGAYEMTPRTTLGLAVTAMYNDLTTDGADYAKGDVDIVYLSSFLRTHLGRWTHTVLAAVGAVDVSLDRTVSYESMIGNLSYRGSYKTFGSSRGMTCGFVYEAAYNKVLNEARTLVVQPLVNVEYRHAHVNAYTEKGSDAGLYVNEVKTNLFTIGVGSRLSGVISDDAFGHTAVLEGRALVKMDTGHNTGRANVRFIHGNLSREVESAPTGIFGLEIGAGCTVSLGIRGVTYFLDSSAEFRDHYTNVNASSGFSITF